MKVVIWVKYSSEISLDEPMGGLERASIEIAKTLDGEVDVLVLGRGDREYITSNILFKGIRCRSEADYLKKCVHYLDNAEFDILHCMTHKYYMLLGKKKFKVIQHFHILYALLFWEHLGSGFHSNSNYSEKQKDFISTRLERLSRWTRMPNEGLDAVIACSGFIKENAVVNVGFPIDVIYNFVDLKEVGDPNYVKEDFILFVGALVPAKGISTLTKAAEILEDEGVTTPIKVIGSSRLWNVDCDDVVVEEFSKRKNIEFLGPKKHIDVIGYMKNAALGVMPSVFPDPSPFVAYEFQACGTPVVASNVGGIPEILEDGETGFLVSPENPGELADKLVFLLKNPGLREKMGEAGRRRIEKHFTTRLIKPKYVKLYSRLMRGLK